MPPRRKANRSAKEIEGIVTTEDYSKADNNVSNQGGPQGFAAAVKRRGGKAAISTQERGEADSANVPNAIVSIRSSKQKALHKILSMDKEDADDCKARATANAGEISNDRSAMGATADPKNTNKKKQRPRAKNSKRTLETIPEDVAAEAHFVESGLMIVSSSKATQANEKKSDRGKRRGTHVNEKQKSDRGKRRDAHANEIDQCKLRQQQEEEQQGTRSQQEEEQGSGSQEGEMITCLEDSKGRGGSSMAAPGQSAAPPPNQAPDKLSKKIVDCLSMPAKKLDSSTKTLAKLEPKKDQILNVRSSTRSKKVVYYSEQSPESDSNEKRVLMSPVSMAPAATNSAAKLLPRGVKRVKEDLLSASEEPSVPGSTRATCVKRGRRHQESSSLQNLSSRTTASTETCNKEERRELQEDRNPKQVNCASANIVDLDKDILVQTAQSESVKVSLLVGKHESDRFAWNQVFQNAVDGRTSAEALSKTAGESVVQNPMQDSQMNSHRKKSNTSKERKINSKRKALPDAVHKIEEDLLDAVPLESGDRAKHEVQEASTCGIKMVKENPVNAQEETLELESGRAPCVRRGRKNQNSGSLQNLPDKKLSTFMNCRGTNENAEAANTLSVSLTGVDLDKGFLLQTGHSETIKSSLPEESTKLFSAPRLEKKNNARSMMRGNRESDHNAQNQDQTMADNRACIEVSSVIATKKNDKNKLNAAKERKANRRRKALPDTAQKDKGDSMDDLPPESDKEAKPKVVEALPVEGAAISMTDARPEDICGTYPSANADGTLKCESQSRGKNTPIKKRSLKGTAQQAKKQKVLELDTLPLPSSLDMLVEGALPAQNQEFERVIQEMEPKDWNAVDVTNFEIRVERSSEKQRKEERKRKRAMKFDALPVGFGLGVSCWSTPTWLIQSFEEEMAAEEDQPVMDSCVESKNPIEEAKKQQFLQETAMPDDAENTNRNSQEIKSSVLGLQVELNNSHMEEKVSHLCEVPMPSDLLGDVKDFDLASPCLAIRLEGSSFSKPDAKRLPASGLKSVPVNDSNYQREKAKVKRQVARKTTKTSKPVLVELPPAVSTNSDDDNMLDKENVEPKHYGHNDSESKTSRKSQRRTATTSMKKTTRTKRN